MRRRMLQQIFASRIQLGTEQDVRVLKGLQRHKKMGGGAQLVYIYSLDKSVPPIAYPRMAGRTIYIGHTKRETGAGRRFVHVSKSLTEGFSTLINHAVSVYYHLATPFYVRVFTTPEGQLAKDAESMLLRAHMHTYGATPIGQGGGGRLNTPAAVHRVHLATGIVAQIALQRQAHHDARPRTLRRQRTRGRRRPPG